MSDTDSEVCPLPRLPGPKVLAPEHHAKFRAFYEDLHYRGQLGPRVKELARLRIAELNACHH